MTYFVDTTVGTQLLEWFDGCETGNDILARLEELVAEQG